MHSLVGAPRATQLRRSVRACLAAFVACAVSLHARDSLRGAETPRSADAVRAFIAKCRNADGGYGPAPGQPSNVGATYFATIVSHWLDAE